MQHGGIETQNDFNPQGTIFWRSRANYNVVWQRDVWCVLHREVSVTPDNLVEIECLRIQ